MGEKLFSIRSFKRIARPFSDLVEYNNKLGCLAVDLTPLTACTSVIGFPIPNSFEYMKLQTGWICLMYETPCQVQFFSIYDHHDFCQKKCLFCLHTWTVTGVTVTGGTLYCVTVFNVVRNYQICHRDFLAYSWSNQQRWQWHQYWSLVSRHQVSKQNRHFLTKVMMVINLEKLDLTRCFILIHQTNSFSLKFHVFKGIWDWITHNRYTNSQRCQVNWKTPCRIRYSGYFGAFGRPCEPQFCPKWDLNYAHQLKGIIFGFVLH